MTFSSRCKNELSRLELENNCCAKAELAALVRTMGVISLKGFSKFDIDFMTENSATARRLFKMIKLLYDVNSEISVIKSNRLKKNNVYSVIAGSDIVERLLNDTLLNKNDTINILDLNYGIPNELIKKSCCARAYIRGAFLGCGSLSDPDKSYHVEFVNNRNEHCESLKKLLGRFELDAKIVLRKENFITYIKNSIKIVDLLNVMKAYNSLLKYENTKAIKETKNSINRIVNCETANLDKIVHAFVRQKNSILLLKKHNILDRLPIELKEVAYLRLENEGAGLKQLGEMMEPPLGKSGVNHRLKKIEKIAEEILLREGE